jgi:hypothetical protein
VRLTSPPLQPLLRKSRLGLPLWYPHRRMARSQMAASVPIPTGAASPSPPPNQTGGPSSPSNRFNLSAFIPRRPRTQVQHARSPTEPSSPGTGPESSSGGGGTYFTLRRSVGPGRGSRTRSASQPPPPSPSAPDLGRPQTAESTDAHLAGAAGAAAQGGAGATAGASASGEQQPGQEQIEHTVRLVPHLELSSRSLSFEPMTRSITPSRPLRIGRFTERGGPANDPGGLNSGRVAFKSKVVSRSHAILSVDAQSDFWVVDTKSSSGQFVP